MNSSFLPGSYQGTRSGHSGIKARELAGNPVEHLENKKLSSDELRYELEMIQKMNRQHAAQRQSDAKLEARIAAFELAFRMQMEAPDAFEVEQESEATKRLYGYDDDVTHDFAWQCLLARRLSERGVRFVQCSHSYKWDQHTELARLHTKNAKEVDKPIGFAGRHEGARITGRHFGDVGRASSDALLLRRAMGETTTPTVTPSGWPGPA